MYQALYIYISIILPILSQLGKLRLIQVKTLASNFRPNCFPPRSPISELMLHNFS